MFKNAGERRAAGKGRKPLEFSRFLIFRELADQPSPATENRSVGGSIPPLGTISYLPRMFRYFCPFGPLQMPLKINQCLIADLSADPFSYVRN
jgi:hypothetical protein